MTQGDRVGSLPTDRSHNNFRPPSGSTVLERRWVQGPLSKSNIYLVFSHHSSNGDTTAMLCLAKHTLASWCCTVQSVGEPLSLVRGEKLRLGWPSPVSQLSPPPLPLPPLVAFAFVKVHGSPRPVPFCVILCHFLSHKTTIYSRYHPMLHNYADHCFKTDTVSKK